MEYTSVGFIKMIDNFLIKSEDLVSALAMISMCLVVCLAIFWRYVLRLPFASGEEIARYLMVWCIYIGIIAATRKQAHVNVTVFLNLLPAGFQRGLVFAGHFITIATFCWLFVLAVMLIQKSAGVSKPQLTPLTRLPYWVMYVSMGVGFGLSAARQIQILVKEFFIKGWTVTAETPGKGAEQWT